MQNRSKLEEEGKPVSMITLHRHIGAFRIFSYRLQIMIPLIAKHDVNVLTAENCSTGRQNDKMSCSATYCDFV